MDKPIYDVAILYTDGSHIPNGTGAGIHGYLYNKEDFVSEQGYRSATIPEAITTKGYQIVPQSTPLPKLPDGLVKFVNCVHPLPKEQTNNIGELLGFIDIFDAPFEAREYFIFPDSMYLINTFTQWVENWEARGWVRADGTPVKNLPLIQAIAEIKKKLVREKKGIRFIKIKGHSNRYGNDMADANARRGSNITALEETVEFKPYWTEEELESVAPETESKADIDITDFPEINAQKFHYLIPNEPYPTLTAGGEKWYYLLSGNHAKKGDDLELVGKMMPDAMYSVTFARKPWDMFYNLVNMHHELAWGDTPRLQRYDPVSIIYGRHLRRKAFQTAAKDGLPLNSMCFSPDNNVWYFDVGEPEEGKTISKSAVPITRIIRPPLLSYRALEIRDELATMLTDCVNKAKNVVLTDITDLLFDAKGKPAKDFYRNVDPSISVTVNYPASDKTIEVVLSREIDMPERPVVNRLYEPGGRFYVAVWRPEKRYLRYAMVYLGNEYHGLWNGYYSAKRILTEEQL